MTLTQLGPSGKRTWMWFDAMNEHAECHWILTQNVIVPFGQQSGQLALNIFTSKINSEQNKWKFPQGWTQTPDNPGSISWLCPGSDHLGQQDTEDRSHGDVTCKDPGNGLGGGKRNVTKIWILLPLGPEGDSVQYKFLENSFVEGPLSPGWGPPGILDSLRKGRELQMLWGHPTWVSNSSHEPDQDKGGKSEFNSNL